MPKGKPRKRPMQATEAPVEQSGAPASNHGDALSMILSAVEQLGSQVKGLADRVDRVENSGPRFVPANPETFEQAATTREQLDNLPADGIPRSTHLPVFPNGERVPEFVLKQMRPKFGSGSRVRLNLEAVPHGRDDGKTRGQLMREAGVPANGVGEVFTAMFLSDDGAWKYRVRFPKQMMPGAIQGIVALYERELVPA